MLLLVVAGFLNITFGTGDGVVVLHTLKISSEMLAHATLSPVILRLLFYR